MFLKAFMLFAALLVVIGILNYNGVGVGCVKYYSDEDKSRIAVEYVFEHYDWTQKLGYVSADEFIELIDNCCSVNLGVVGSDMKPFYRLAGRLSDYVLVPKIPKHTLIGKTDLEIETIKNNLLDKERAVVAVSNCGTAWDPFD